MEEQNAIDAFEKIEADAERWINESSLQRELDAELEAHRNRVTLIKKALGG